jgi:uncharacterized repeat protein (TIGR03803 family)
MTSKAQHRRGIPCGRGAAIVALALGMLLHPALSTAQSGPARTHSEAFTYEVLYAFAGGADGGIPAAGLVLDNAGNLYGTTEYRGTSDWGIVFKLDTTGTETVLHSFTGGADGATPRAGLILDSTGNLYGTALQGGPPCGSFTCGVVFKVDSSGNQTVLHGFTGADGLWPEAGLLRDSGGNLYGTTSAGGSSGHGVVFKLDATTGTETVLYTFTGAADGAQPLAGLVPDSAGNLYGTTQTGGDFSTCTADGCGVMFKLDPTTGQETVLHTFTGGADGRYPSGNLVQDSVGNLYGTTGAGGASCIFSGEGCGVVFKLDSVTGKETVLYTFTGGTDGASPDKASLFLDEAGNLYGTAIQGGDAGVCGGAGCGVVFRLDSATGEEDVLYAFTGGADGEHPAAGLIRDSAGNFYGTASAAGTCDFCGVVFKLTPAQTSFTVSVTLAGSGGGTITSAPVGINCGATCSANFVNGSTVVLTATPAAGSGFSGWSGNCSGTAGCTLTASASVTAAFEILPADFSLTPTSTRLTMQAGAQKTDTINIAPQNGAFETAIQLSCAITGPSPMPACALSPASVTPGANSVASTLTITVPASAMLALSSDRRISSLPFAMGVPLAMLGMVTIKATRRERRQSWMLFAFLLPFFFLLAACGGSRAAQPESTHYTVTVTGTSGTIQHATPVSVTVQ